MNDTYVNKKVEQVLIPLFKLLACSAGVRIRLVSSALERKCKRNAQKHGMHQLRIEVEGIFSEGGKLKGIEEDVGVCRMIQWGEQELRLLDTPHRLIVGCGVDTFQRELKNSPISPLDRHCKVIFT